MTIFRNPSDQGFDERKDAVAVRAAQARLRALDAMLGGVAHDLNNALSVVLMNLDVMQQDPALTGKHARRIDGMLDAMTNASALVRHLLNFSHSRRPEPEVVSVADALPPLIELVQVAAGRKVDIVTEPGETGPCCALVDVAGFEVAVVHAALQLAEAMPRGGILTFSLGQGEPPGEQIVLTLEAAPRNPLAAEEERDHHLDLEIVEHFAQDAQGRVTSSAAGANGYRIAIYLPASSEITTL